LRRGKKREGANCGKENVIGSNGGEMGALEEGGGGLVCSTLGGETSRGNYWLGYKNQRLEPEGIAIKGLRRLTPVLRKEGVGTTQRRQE